MSSGYSCARHTNMRNVPNIAGSTYVLAGCSIKVKAKFNKGRKPKESEVGQRVLLNVRNLQFKGLHCPKFMPRSYGWYCTV